MTLHSQNIPHRPSPVSDTTCPGCSCPANQAHAPAPTGAAPPQMQTSGPCRDSCGEIQHKNPAVSGSVTVTPGTVPTVDLHGASGCLPSQVVTVAAQSTGRGLPANVMADGGSPSRPQAPTIANCSPPAVDVSAGSARQGTGLPVNVVVR